MSILELIDELEAEINESASLPFSGKKLVDKAVALEILNDMRANLPEEIMTANKVLAERKRILAEAKMESDAVLKEAEERISKMVDEHEIMQQAYKQSNELLAKAQANAKEIRLGAESYADEVLKDIERYIQEYLAIIAKNREELSNRK